MATVVTTASERKKRLKLKRIVVSEHNYLALKRLGQAGDSFNDVISKLLRIHSIYQAKVQQEEQERQQQENDVEKYNPNNDGLPFPVSPSEFFGEQDIKQLAGLLGLSRRNNSGKSQPIKEEKED